MGEMTFEQTAMVEAVDGALAGRGSGDLHVITPGGRFQVRWDESGNASALGQLAFFAEFLDVSGLFERWVVGCPMSYTSNNAPDVRDVLGTWLLSILDGQRRYAHITGLRGDGVAPEILGMTQIISDESLRRALKHLAPCVGGTAMADCHGGRGNCHGGQTTFSGSLLRHVPFRLRGSHAASRSIDVAERTDARHSARQQPAGVFLRR